MGERNPSATPVATTPGSPVVTRIRFAAAPEPMVEFASHQATGTIGVELSSGADVVFEVLQQGDAAAARDAAPVELLLLPTGLRVQNRAGNTADYRILVPSASRLIRIRIGDSPPLELSAAELTSGSAEIATSEPPSIRRRGL